MAESSIRDQIRPELRESFDAWRSLMNTDEGALAAMRGHDGDPVLISEGGGADRSARSRPTPPSGPAAQAQASLVEAEVERVASRFIPATRARVVTLAERRLGRSESSVRDAVAAAVAEELRYSKALGLEESIKVGRRPSTPQPRRDPGGKRVQDAPAAAAVLLEEAFGRLGLSETAAKNAAKGR